MSSLLKNLTLVAVGLWVGRRYGDVIARDVPTSRHPRYRARRRRMHHGRGVAGPPATGAWDSIGASTRGLRWTWFVLVGDRNKASDGGSRFVEFPRSGRKVEEQLRARQGFCWGQRQ